MRKFENDGKAGFVLNDTFQCICENATHHDYKRIFGGKCEDGWGEKYIIFDNVNNLYLPTYNHVFIIMYKILIINIINYLIILLVKN